VTSTPTWPARPLPRSGRVPPATSSTSTDPDSFAAFLAAAQAEHGQDLDVLVNNAGVMPNGAFLEGTERIDRLMMDVNVHGVINGMRLACRAWSSAAAAMSSTSPRSRASSR
jgi:NADP-dependent 3-hydroxy acid dehydrogenase YdfG